MGSRKGSRRKPAGRTCGSNHGKRFRNIHRAGEKCLSFILVLMTVLTIGILFGSLTTSFARSGENRDFGRTKYYTSIQIMAGDSLETIASRYITPEYENYREYEDEVIQINHLSHEGTIHPGCYLAVPYYR